MPAAVDNVVLVTIDSLRQDALGGEDSASPVLDDLAAEGITFENAMAQGNWTPFSFPSIHGSRPVFDEGPDIALPGVDEPPGVMATLVSCLKKDAITEMIPGDVRDRNTRRRAHPVRVQYERVVRPIENPRRLCRATVLGRETVGVIIGGEKRVLNGVECRRPTGGVIDPPQPVGGGM